MPGGKGNIKPEDGKQFSSDYQPQEKWTEKKAIDLGDELIKWLNEVDENNQDKGNIFFEEFIVIVKDFYPDLIGYLCKKFTSFLELIKKAKKIQELKLYKYGIADRLNAQMTKFVLINEHNKINESGKFDHTSKGKQINSKTIVEFRDYSEEKEDE